MRGIKQMLNQQELVVGLITHHTCRAWLAKLYADAGADFVYVENEHMMFNEADLGDFILSCRLCDLPVVAKSTYLDRGSITKLLDAGVTGIQLPMSESAGQLEDLVKYAKFPPVGKRAASPGVGNTSYESVNVAAWLEQANEETTIIAQVESREGIDHIDELMQVPEVDIMLIGSLDLSVSLRRPAQLDHPDVRDAMKRLVASARAHGKVAGMWTPSYESAKFWIGEGVRFFQTTSDIWLIGEGARKAMADFPDHGPGVPAKEGFF